VVKISGKGRKSHLVAVVKGEVLSASAFDIAEVLSSVRGLSSLWFLFNDFVVTNIS